MKQFYLFLLCINVLNLNSTAQTNMQADVNDVLVSHNKLVIQSAGGQSYFIGHQLGGSYSYPDGIYRAITDQANGDANIFLMV
ncbi:hypothetical protein KXQ82_10480 [Mucilaginibacter sp. HMF5004]|uniref:hypothetical protein n=1 Tax=Mucilaginibacter rivuli TaxID=2857527 RepID=UPI001C5D1A94|nr:hypothetical protein [Mucilaginibacter rivuli]MBW4890145.1 hypothetical protein [Mucilaginibacter rivuli]